MIRVQYVDAWHLKTVAEIVPRYAPPSSNDTGGYIGDIIRYVEEFRK